LKQLNLAGGAMMFAPVIATEHETRVDSVSVATTRWVLQSEDSITVAKALPTRCQLKVPQVSFSWSKYQAIRMYEDGYVIEGCGLGACLEFAEQLGLTEKELIDSLDSVVAPWFDKIQ
jgi:NaMN:DMB phosphoribosyltransferase